MEIELQKIKNGVGNYFGRWENSYDKARIIGAFTIFQENGELQIAVEGSPNGIYPGDWTSTTLKAHSYDPDSDDVVAFQASYNLEDITAFLAINENKGLLIIAGYFTFKTNKGKSDFFVREFFTKI